MKIAEVICQILRINSIEQKTAGTQDTLLLRVRTECGLEGIGDADASPEVIKAIVDAPYSHNIACGLREPLTGMNPLDHDLIREKLYRRTMYFGRRAAGVVAMAGIDMALWDLKGKYFNQPIHRLRGGKRHETIPAAGSGRALARDLGSGSGRRLAVETLAGTGRLVTDSPDASWQAGCRGPAVPE